MDHTLSSSAPPQAPRRPGGSDPAGVAVQVDHLRKSYRGQIVVDDVSFSVEPGEIFGILGPNGAGKTTIAECAQGLRRPDSGRVQVLGRDVHRQGRALRPLVGSQLQSSALPDRVKVWEAVDLFARLAGHDTPWQDLLDRWGLADQNATAFADLSGGQAQRLFVALALLGRPQVVFLDELTQGLDPAGRRVAWELIRDIRHSGTTVVLVTHYMDEAEHLCDRVVVIDHGRVLAQGTPQELIATGARGIRITFSTDAADVSWLEALSVVEQVHRRGRHVEIRGSGPVLALVAAALVDHQIVPADLRVVQPTLEDAYLHLTAPTGSRLT